VRDLGECARVEVDAELVPSVRVRSDVVDEAVRGAGFGSWELDPRGFRSGALNERP
jgi:pyridinium-3,5-biscarboxylic acid mononucleotide sulfurtransferase